MLANFLIKSLTDNTSVSLEDKNGKVYFFGIAADAKKECFSDLVIDWDFSETEKNTHIIYIETRKAINERIKEAVIYCAGIHDMYEDVRNDAANIFSNSKSEYEEIWKALEFNN